MDFKLFLIALSLVSSLALFAERNHNGNNGRGINPDQAQSFNETVGACLDFRPDGNDIRESNVSSAQSILNKRCSECHGSTDVNNFIANGKKKSIKQIFDAINSGKMPKNSALPKSKFAEGEKDTVLDWLETL